MNNAKKPTIIFDISGVLFQENRLRLLTKIGLKNVAHFIIKHKKNPITSCFAALKEISIHEQSLHTIPVTQLEYRGNLLPSCITQWQKGLMTNQEVLTYLEQEIEILDQKNYFFSAIEKKLIKQVMYTLVDTQDLKRVLLPIKPVISLLNHLKKERYKLYILSNQSHETFTFLTNNYPSVFSLFDGAIISAQVQLVKPDKAIYQHLLDTYHLNPAECIFIDDQPENVVIAENMDIKGIHYTTTNDLKMRLSLHGVI